MQTALTDLAIKKLPPGNHWDTHTRGLALRVGKTARTFYVLVGSGQRHTIGRYPIITLAEARVACKRLLAEKTLGRIFNRRVAFQDAVDSFLADSHIRNRPRTTADYTRLLRRHFPFGRQALADLTPRQITDRLNRLCRKPSEKHHAFTAARRFFRFCIQNHLLDRSPMEAMATPGNRASRDRVLFDDELRALYRCAHAGTTPFHRIVALLILTGARRSEIAALQWTWIKDTTIELPADITKNGRKHIIPIGHSARSIIKEICPLHGNPYLFPAQRQRTDATTCFNGWGKPKARFDQESGVSDWVLHDLRRCFAVGLQKLGTRLEVIEVLLNHISGSRAGVVGTYQRYSWEPEAREAALKWEAYLATLLPPAG